MYRRNFLAAFWEKVDDSGGPDACWPWTAACYPDDYGMLGIRRPNGGRTTMRAHVMALILATGEDANGRFGLHSCDNPPCCNAAHLRWGTQKQNIADMDARERGRRPIHRGVSNPKAKLTEDEVRAIRARYKAGGVTQQTLADQYGVSQFVVSLIVRRKSWAHVT